MSLVTDEMVQAAARSLFANFAELDSAAEAEYLGMVRAGLEAAVAVAPKRFTQYGHEVPAGHPWEDTPNWAPEVRGIKYARFQRDAVLLFGDPVYIDHWTYKDHRHPVEGCDWPDHTNTTVEATRQMLAEAEDRMHARELGL